MATDNHTPITTGAAANASVVNAPLGQLDAVMGDVDTLTTDASTLVGGVNEVHALISTEVDAEAFLRATADTLEEAERVSADNILTAAVDDLDDALTVETAARIAADSTEATARALQDSVLQALINAVSTEATDNAEVIAARNGGNTNASVSSLANRVGFAAADAYHPMAYSANGDGTTDDRATLNTLFNTTMSAGGYAVIDRDYAIATALSVPANVTLVFRNSGKFVVGSTSIRTASYRWDLHEQRTTISTTGSYWLAGASGTSNYYFVQQAWPSTDQFPEPDKVYANNVAMTAGTLGALTAGQYAWGDNDTLGYDTLYVRLSDSTDPDTKSSGYMEYGHDEYYLLTSGGGNPSISEPPGVSANSIELPHSDPGSLVAGEWGYGDVNSLGFDTIYIRLSDNTDPDGKATNYVRSGVTVTILGDIQADNAQIVSGVGGIRFGGGKHQIVRPEWFGSMAVNATIPIQKACRALNDGGELILPPGSYTTSVNRYLFRLRELNGVTVRGQNTAIETLGHGLLIEDSEHVTISSIAITREDYATFADPWQGVFMQNVKHVRVEDCEFNKFQDGISVSAGTTASEWLWFVRCKTRWISQEPIAVRATNTSGLITRCKHVRVVDCDFSKHLGDGTMFKSTSDLVMEGCRLHQPMTKNPIAHTGLTCDTTNGSPVIDVLLSAECTVAMSDFYVGQRVTISAATISSVPISSIDIEAGQITLTSNAASTQSGVEMKIGDLTIWTMVSNGGKFLNQLIGGGIGNNDESSTGNANRLIIQNNVVDTCNYGMRIHAFDDLYIIGNRVSGINTQDGILLGPTQACTNAIVAENFVDIDASTKYGIYARQIDSTQRCSGVTIRGNHSVSRSGSSDYGIYTSTDKTVINGNVINAGGRGIAVTSNDCVITNNQVNGVSNRPIAVSGHNNIIANNSFVTNGATSDVAITGNGNIIEGNEIEYASTLYAITLSAATRDNILRNNRVRVIDIGGDGEIDDAGANSVDRFTRGLKEDSFPGTAPTIGAWPRGSVRWRNNISVADGNGMFITGYYVAVAGQYGTLNGVTANITNATNSAALTFGGSSTIADFYYGAYVTISAAGITEAKVLTVNTTTNTITLSANATSTQAGTAVAYGSNPTLLTMYASSVSPVAVTKGTWAAAITGSISNPTVTYTLQLGHYTTNGVVVQFHIALTISTISGGSGDIRISLPLTALNTSGTGTVTAVRIDGPDVSTSSVIFRVDPGQAYGHLRSNNDNAASTAEQISSLANGDIIQLSGYYFLV